MSTIAEQVTRIKGNVSASYDAIQDKGGILPVDKVSDNLPLAIGSIPSGGAGRYEIPPPNVDFYIAVAYGSIGLDAASTDVKYYYALSQDVFVGASTQNDATRNRNVNLYTTPDVFGELTAVWIRNIVAIFFGSKYHETAIPDHFLRGFLGIEQTIYFPEGITSIGNNVLGDNFLQNPDVVFPNSLISIGHYFMYSTSTSFVLGNTRSPIIIPPNVESIGHNFLALTGYNHPVTIPPSVKTIGQSFLGVSGGAGGGGAFNHDLTFPETLQAVDYYCCQQLWGFTKTIYIECPAEVFTVYGNNGFATASTDAQSPARFNGLRIGGKYAAELIARFPNRTSTPWRTLVLASAPALAQLINILPSYENTNEGETLELHSTDIEILEQNPQILAAAAVKNWTIGGITE